MFNRKDPLLESVKSVMKENDHRRRVESYLCESLGIYSRKQLTREDQAYYDALLEQCLIESRKKELRKEELVGNQHKIDANKNNRVDAHDFKLLRSKKNVSEQEGETSKTSDMSMGQSAKPAARPAPATSSGRGSPPPVRLAPAGDPKYGMIQEKPKYIREKSDAEINAIIQGTPGQTSSGSDKSGINAAKSSKTPSSSKDSGGENVSKPSSAAPSAPSIKPDDQTITGQDDKPEATKAPVASAAPKAPEPPKSASKAAGAPAPAAATPASNNDNDDEEKERQELQKKLGPSKIVMRKGEKGYYDFNDSGVSNFKMIPAGSSVESLPSQTQAARRATSASNMNESGDEGTAGAVRRDGKDVVSSTAPGGSGYKKEGPSQSDREALTNKIKSIVKESSHMMKKKMREKEMDEAAFAGPETGPRRTAGSNQPINEKAPPGAKFERMVKHIKDKYKEGGLSKKEKSIAYATAWKAKNKELDEEEAPQVKPNTETEKGGKTAASPAASQPSTPTPQSALGSGAGRFGLSGVRSDTQPTASSPAASSEPSTTVQSALGSTASGKFGIKGPTGDSGSRPSAPAGAVQSALGSGAGKLGVSGARSETQPTAGARPAARPAAARPTAGARPAARPAAAAAPTPSKSSQMFQQSQDNASTYGGERASDFFAADRQAQAERRAAATPAPAARPAAARPAAARPAAGARTARGAGGTAASAGNVRALAENFDQFVKGFLRESKNDRK